MDAWLQPWKPFIPLVDMSQFIPLVDAIPSAWQIVFAVILLTLLIVYYLFLVIRVSPWHWPRRKSPSKEPNSEPSVAPIVKQNSPKRRQRQRKR